jgi:hypothetical protein
LQRSCSRTSGEGESASGSSRSSSSPSYWRSAGSPSASTRRWGLTSSGGTFTRARGRSFSTEATHAPSIRPAPSRSSRSRLCSAARTRTSFTHCLWFPSNSRRSPPFGASRRDGAPGLPRWLPSGLSTRGSGSFASISFRPRSSPSGWLCRIAAVVAGGRGYGVGAAVKWSPAVALPALTVYLLVSRRPRDAVRLVLGFIAAVALVSLPYLV